MTWAPKIERIEVRAADRGWVRVLHYLRRDLCSDRVHLAARDDESSIYNDRYAPTCAACWLGHCHSVARHEQLVEAQR